MEKLDFENGRLTNGTFTQYKMPRFRDVPPITIILLDPKDLSAAGEGETPIVVIAPAIASAVSALIESHQCKLPLRQT